MKRIPFAAALLISVAAGIGGGVLLVPILDDPDVLRTHYDTVKNTLILWVMIGVAATVLLITPSTERFETPKRTRCRVAMTLSVASSVAAFIALGAVLF